MTVEVVKIRNGAPLLTDIPALLRDMADKIERGEYRDIGTMFVVVPVISDYPRLWAWGNIDGKNDPCIQLELAHRMVMDNLVTR